MKRLLCLLVAALIAVFAPLKAEAAYPNRPVNVLVGFAAGGAGDIIARSVAAELEKELGQPVVIVNKGGSGGALAIGEALSKAPDGYTVIATISAAITIDTLTKKSRYNLDDFRMLGMTGVYQEGFFCLADKPWKNMREMVEWAKKENKPLSYPSSVVFDKIITKYIGKKEGVEFRAVPVQGGASIISNVLGGHTDFGCGGGLQASYVRAGKMRNLASWGVERLHFFPETPTMADQGWPLLQFDNYFAFYVSKKVPAEIADKLESALMAAGNNPAVQRLWRNAPGSSRPFSPARNPGKFWKTASSAVAPFWLKWNSLYPLAVRRTAGQQGLYPNICGPGGGREGLKHALARTCG